MPPKGVKLPTTVGVRFSTELREKLADYMGRNNLNASQAVRVLLETALAAEGSNPDAVFRHAMVHEGLIKGMGIFRKRLSEAVEKALKDIGESG